MDLLGVRGGGGCGVPLALTIEGCMGVLFFMINQKNIREKMRYSNLSNNMMITNCEQQLQFKYSSQERVCSSQAS